MHKRILNALRIEFRLKPKGPLLVKAGVLSPNPSLPDMQFVRTITPQGEQVFIPGSSLKGVFRSFTEKVLRTLDARWACDPFDDKGACGRRLREVEDSAQIYRQSCRACKIYGNTRLRGRLAFTDAMPQGAVSTETRYGVAISRLTNAVAVGPFDVEVLTQGVFRGALMLENFEIWHLGLLAFTIQAVNQGLVRIGFGKNRGFGEVECTVERATVDMAKASAIPADALWGVGVFLQKEERERYGVQEERLVGIGAPTQVHDLGVLVRRVYSGDAWKGIEEKAIEHLRVLEKTP